MSQRADTKAYRLTFSYDEDQITLISRQEVDMQVIASDPIDEAHNEPGFSFELQDTRGKTLYRRRMHNPISPDLEVFSDEPSRSVHRAKNPINKGVFTVVAPAMADADSVRLVDRAIHRERGAKPAVAGEPPAVTERELGKFKIHP